MGGVFLRAFDSGNSDLTLETVLLFLEQHFGISLAFPDVHPVLDKTEWPYAIQGH